MTHTYELRSAKDDGSMTTVLKLTSEPKYAKARARDYANRHPGLYLLQRIDTVSMYCTEKEVDKND